MALGRLHKRLRAARLIDANGVYKREHRSSRRLGGRTAFWRLCLLPLAGLGLLASMTLAVMIGPVDMSPLTVWKIVVHESTGLLESDWSLVQQQIVWNIRMPRALLAAIVGAGLAVVGATLQAAVRNPLADPFLLGGSSGASVGAVLVIVSGLSVFGVYSLSIAAFLGSLAAFAIVFVLAHQGGRVWPLRLILSGVAVSYVFSAITNFIVFRADDAEQVRSAQFWMLGGLGGASWEQLKVTAIVLVGGTVFLILQARSLNSLLVGDQTATTLGVDTSRLRRMLLVLTALVTGVMVAVSGGIGFVGLMVPHMVRLLVGSDHRRLLPLTLLLGAVFLVWADVAARSIVAPAELPIGVVTSLIGGPFFIWLMSRQSRSLQGA